MDQVRVGHDLLGVGELLVRSLAALLEFGLLDKHGFLVAAFDFVF